MRFLLTGGGEFDHFKRVDAAFERALNKNDTVLIIPYACAETDYPEILNRIKDTYDIPKKGLNFSLKENISTLLEEDVSDAKSIFIEGGNTFDLITAIRDANVATFLKKLSKSQDKIFYADSAGAIILGASVQTAFLGDDADDDERRLQDYRGLNLLGGWAVHAHYTPEDDESVMNLVYDQGIPILALHEETGIEVSPDFSIKVLTEAPLVIFTAAGKQKIQASDTVSLRDFY